MIKFEAMGSTSFAQENNFIAQRAEKSFSNIYTLASNLDYSQENNYKSTQLGNTVISLF